MAAMAVLHGLSPVPVDRCRVLEIACSEGANLIPMAYAIPSSEFVGFDLASLPVERGQRRARDLGLRNLRLFQSDLLAVGPELGHFDYIIAHGLYAWIPEVVSDRLLALCGELLSENGVVFVSYNTLPGSYPRLAARDALLFGSAGIEDPLDRVTAGLEFLDFVAKARPDDDLFGALLQDQIQRMQKRGPAVTCHDEMTGAYRPTYFSHFVEHANRHGLQYLDESELPPPPDPSYSMEIQSALESAAGGDFFLKEQLLDFVRWRTYRENLLCRAGRTVAREFAPERFRDLLFASQTTPAPGEKPGSTAFVLPGGIRMESNHPAVTGMLKRLGEVWPRALSFDELEPLLAETGFSLNAEGAGVLIRLAIARMIELHVWNAPIAAGVPPRPRASACCRQQALEQRMATSLLHKTVSLEDPKVRTLLLLLDGSRDHKELFEALKAEFPDTAPEELESGLEPALRLFQASGVLEG